MGVSFHPESAWTFGCMPLQLRLNKTRNQLEHAEGPAQPPKKSQHIAYLWSLCASIYAFFDSSEYQATLKGGEVT